MVVVVNLQVAPLVGAWIESQMSDDSELSEHVAPLVGAWIERYIEVPSMSHNIVAPLVGAWIERKEAQNIVAAAKSLLL